MTNQIAGKIDKAVNFIIKGTIILLPLFFLPWTSEYFEFNKQFFLWLAMPLALFLWLVKMYVQGELKFKTNILNLPILLFLFLTLLSSIFSLDRFSSFFGFFGGFSDAWLGLLSLMIFYFLLINASVADSAEKIYSLVKLFVYSALAVAAISFLAIIGLLKPLFTGQQSLLASPWFNPAGNSLTSLEIYLAAASVVLIGFLFGNIKKYERYIFGGGLALIITIAVLINFSLFSLKPPKEAVLGYGPALEIIKQEFNAAPFLGSGPGTFAYNFSLFRPPSLNQNSLWQIRYDKSASQILELPVTAGPLALLSYLLIISLVVYLNIKLLVKRWKTTSTEVGRNNNLIYILFVAFILLLLSQIFFLTNTVLNFSFWLFLALLMAFWQMGGPPIFQEKNVNLRGNLIYSRLWLITLFLVAGLWLALAGYEIKIFVADVYAASDDNREAGLTRAIELNYNRYNYGVFLAKLYLSRAGIEAQKFSAVRDKNYIQNNISLAIDTAKQAVAVMPNSVLAWETLGMIYRDIAPLTVGSEPWVVESFNHAVTLEPTNPVLATELAKAYLNNNELAKAENYFKKARELKPDYYEAKFGQAKVYLKEKKDGMAFDLLTELTTEVTDQEIFYELGRYYYNHGEIDKAIERFELVLSLNPKHINSLYGLGIAYEAKGDSAEALKYYEKVLELNPGNEEVIKKIKALENK